MSLTNTTASTVARFRDVRGLTEVLTEPLSPEDQVVQSMPDVSPTKWHRAHTSWFFEEFVLQPYAAGDRLFHPGFRYLFNSYYEAVGPRHARAERGLLSRPGVDEIAAYRADVDDRVVAFLERSPEDDHLERIELGLHHEQQHQELLLMDIKHVLSRNPLRPAYRETPAAEQAPAPPPLRWVACEGGLVELGHDGCGFAFDNERPRHRAVLAPFALASRLVTCGEWLAFIDDGGYGRPELWLSDGWATVVNEGWDAPLYWERVDGDWWVFTLTGLRRVRRDEPVCHVSYYEADAFARWAGARLPVEAEWEVAATAAASVGPVVGLDLGCLHPSPAPGRVAGCEQLFGEVWSWTSSAYAPYPGFRPAAGAVGEYNGKFMVNQYVLRGSSCVTPGDHARATYRNFFPPSARWPFTGVRLARDA